MREEGESIEDEKNIMKRMEKENQKKKSWKPLSAVNEGMPTDYRYSKRDLTNEGYK